MAKAINILTSSIRAFSQNYQSLAATTALLAFPFSAILLLSQSFTSSSSPIHRSISSHFHAIFEAAGFPATSQFFSLLNLKLSQTVFSFLFCLPFTLTFYVLTKAATIQIVLLKSRHGKLISLYRFLLPTHLFNSFIILSANSAVFSLLFLAFNTLDIFQLASDNYILCLSAASAVLYSIVLANTTAACNLATVVSAMESCSGYSPVLRACVLLQGNEATAMTVALPASLGTAALEALFQYMIVRAFSRLGDFTLLAAGEACLIAYLCALLVVLDTIISCMLYRHFQWQIVDADHVFKDDLRA